MYGSNSIYESAMFPSPCSPDKPTVQSNSMGVSDVGSGGGKLEKAISSGVMVGDVVWLRDDGSGELSSIVSDEEEALQELMSAPFVVVAITGGLQPASSLSSQSTSSLSSAKSITPYRVTCQRLSHHKYFRALLLKLQRSQQVMPTPDEITGNKEQKKGNQSIEEANTESIEVGVNLIVCENLSLLSFYSFLRRNYFPGGEYRPKYLRLLEPSVGGGG